jgi:hypothetical protein
MTDEDKALARQALVENDWDNHIEIPKLIQLVRADEREENAKVCEEHGQKRVALEHQYISKQCAAAIRARGQA